MKVLKIVLILSVCILGIFSSRGRPAEFLEPERSSENRNWGEEMNRTEEMNTEEETSSGGELSPYVNLGGESDTSDELHVTSTLTNETFGNYTDTEHMRGGFNLRLYSHPRLGNYIVDPNNMALYMFELDHIGTGFTEADFEVKCYDECARDWPPLIIEDPTMRLRAGDGLNPELLGMIARRDGTNQLTYNNIPLYYYRGDRRPGDTAGHLLNANGGSWYLISPEGFPITS